MTMKPMRKRNENTWILIGIIIIVVLAAAIFFRPGKGDKKTVPQAQVKKGKAPSSFTPVITKINIEPGKPRASDSIRALPVLKDPRMRNSKFQYQWFVNGDEVPGADMDMSLLEKKHYIKGDKVYCRVKALRGKYESEVVESRKIEIGNSPPIIKFSMVDRFNVPGRFRYNIHASDPDDDPLTYRLVAPLDRGIDIHPETGEILWDIDETQLPAKEKERERKKTSYKGEEGSPREGSTTSGRSEGLKAVRKREKERPRVSRSPIVRIEFEVLDSDGAAAVSFIDINLLKGHEVHE